MVLAAPVHQVDVVASGARVAHVEVLAQLYVAERPQDEDAAVSPGAEPARGEPVDPEVAGGTVVTEQRAVTEIFQAGMVLVGVVGHPAADHLGVGVAGEVQELFGLVAPDVAQDPAVTVPLEEPRRPGREVGPVRPHADHLHDPPDDAVPYQPAGEDGALHVHSLAVIDGVLAARLLYRPSGLGELRQGGQGRLVGEVVLAMAHDPQSQSGVLGRHSRARHELDARILQDLAFARRHPHAREPLGEGGRLGRVGVEDPLELRTGLGQPVAHAVNVAVVEGDGGEDELTLVAYRRRLASRRVVLAIGRRHGLPPPPI